MLIKALAAVNRIQGLFCSHILLYHATYSDPPKCIKNKLHNVVPDMLYKQINWLKKHFDIVQVDDIFREKYAGKVAITFDDGYEPVFKEVVPVLLSLNVPFTIFIAGISLKGRPFWRDKIRYLINNSMVGDFISFIRKNTFLSNRLSIDNFYTMTKAPEINSFEIDKFLDDFFIERKINLGDIVYCVKDKNLIIDNPLISYGNHTFNHYVLSSLTDEQQEFEISENYRLVGSLSRRASKIFSVPFGSPRCINAATLKILKKYNYKGLLYARGYVNIGFISENRQTDYGLLYRERYMVAPAFDLFQKQFAKNCLKTLWKLLRGLQFY